MSRTLQSFRADSSSKTTDIPVFRDTNGNDFVRRNDIQQCVANAKHITNGSDMIMFMTDEDLDDLIPRRIAYHLGVVLEVVASDDHQRGFDTANDFEQGPSSRSASRVGNNHTFIRNSSSETGSEDSDVDTLRVAEINNHQALVLLPPLHAVHLAGERPEQQLQEMNNTMALRERPHQAREQTQQMQQQLDESQERIQETEQQLHHYHQQQQQMQEQMDELQQQLQHSQLQHQQQMQQQLDEFRQTLQEQQQHVDESLSRASRQRYLLLLWAAVFTFYIVTLYLLIFPLSTVEMAELSYIQLKNSQQQTQHTIQQQQQQMDEERERTQLSFQQLQESQQQTQQMVQQQQETIQLQHDTIQQQQDTIQQQQDAIQQHQHTVQQLKLQFEEVLRLRVPSKQSPKQPSKQPSKQRDTSTPTIESSSNLQITVALIFFAVLFVRWLWG